MFGVRSGVTPGTSLHVQWLRLHTPSAEGLGSGQGSRSHIPQLKILCAIVKT